MDMRSFMKSKAVDIEGYKAAMCYELAGKNYKFSFDGGETVSMAFSAFPAREVSLGSDAKGVQYYCAKIAERVLFFSYTLPESCAGYVFDMDTNLITRVVTGATGETAVTSGAVGNISERHTIATDEMKDVTFRWTLGRLKDSIFLMDYSGNGVSISRPNAPDAPALSVSGFSAVRINKNIILQVATVKMDKAEYHVCFVSNFWSILCVGSIYSASPNQETVYKLFGGHGRYAGPNATNDGSDGTGLFKLSPFKGIGIAQFAPPHSYELAGENFEFAMDDGYDYFLRIIDDKTLEWNLAGEKPTLENYICQKPEDTTYLLSFELKGVTPRVNHTFVIDMENYLVTRLISKIGTNPKYPYLMKTDYEFGAIRKAGEDVKVYPRHGFTDDVIGTCVEWTYTSEGASLHVYYCSNSYRLTFSRDPVYHEMAARMSAMLNNADRKLPSTDEPSTYIKIKDGLYLFTLTEANGEKLLGSEMGGYRSNTMSFMHNFHTTRTFGRAFGTTTPPDADEIHTHMLYAAYGKLINPKDFDDINSMNTDPNPYRI